MGLLCVSCDTTVTERHYFIDLLYRTNSQILHIVVECIFYLLSSTITILIEEAWVRVDQVGFLHVSPPRQDLSMQPVLQSLRWLQGYPFISASTVHPAHYSILGIGNMSVFIGCCCLYLFDLVSFVYLFKKIYKKP